MVAATGSSDAVTLLYSCSLSPGAHGGRVTVTNKVARIVESSDSILVMRRKEILKPGSCFVGW